ncbi:hypothetical protein Golomagni_03144 [Golovinomyces magnicellulatus]|nr:hypothetical protein Golomagni_03144 [Golovinomyces magnicellulatus]
MDLDSVQEIDRKARCIQQRADVLIVGAGVFGCAMAVALANQGRSVVLLERSLKQPDRIVGELLQPGGVSALEKLGLAQCLEGIDSVPVHGYQVIYHGTSVSIPYPSPNNENTGKHGYTSLKEGKPEGRSFHHGRFISQLRKACFNHPNITVVETLVLETIKNTLTDVVLGVKSETMNEKTKKREKDFFFGDLTIIADGKFYALELIDCPLPVPYYGTVILGDGSPVLLYQIGTHETRALIDVPENTPSASVAAGGIRNHIRNVVLPSLPSQIQPFFEKAMEDGKIPRSMPNSWLPPSMQQQKGVILLGDAMNMRHPLTGGGMTVALNDVVYLSELLSPDRVPHLENTAAIQRAMKEFHWKRKSLSSVINILAMALYSLFAANDRQLKALQRGCFAYFQKGGNCVDGPVGLLAGIIRQPIVLFYHFFAVAFVSIGITVSETMGNLFGIWKVPLALRESTLIFWKACVVILPFIFSEIQK